MSMKRRAPLEHGARVRVADQASELFCEHVLQDVLVQAQVCHKLLELAVLLLKLLQAPQLARAEPAVELLPA